MGDPLPLLSQHPPLPTRDGGTVADETSLAGAPLPVRLSAVG
ncbi:hypothetical protein RISK_004891 [Rhodopirellula islandica]|uniref:Uncharacterized protein n=1 Tax=Rhodopirellula islandica TaxID=595434 RepID=A0A0J1B8H9_RHOIS|nr:hypothetical protein RISK_004891 [Rhodopirellula islandica]